MSVLLDTNLLIDYLRNIPQSVKYLEKVAEEASISAISVAELHSGARNNEEREMLRQFTSSFAIIAVDESICETGGAFRAQYGPSHGIDLIDGLIAATSLVRQLPLATLNRKHFPMLKDLIVPYRRQ